MYASHRLRVKTTFVGSSVTINPRQPNGRFANAVHNLSRKRGTPDATLYHRNMRRKPETAWPKGSCEKIIGGVSVSMWSDHHGIGGYC